MYNNTIPASFTVTGALIELVGTYKGMLLHKTFGCF